MRGRRVPTVYFIAHAGRIKIGFTQNLQERLKSFRTVIVDPIEVVGSISGNKADERGFHERFAALRVGGEWFQDVPELRGALAEIVATAPLPVAEPVAKWKPKTVGAEPEPQVNSYEEELDRLDAEYSVLLKDHESLVTDRRSSACADLTDYLERLIKDAITAARHRYFYHVGAAFTPGERRDEAFRQIRAEFGRVEMLIANIFACDAEERGRATAA